MTYKKIKIPKKGEKISYKKGVLTVPDNPIIPFIEGDGIGVDITPPMINVVNQAVKIAYSGERKIEWMEVYCGEKATQVYDKDTWLPDETIEALKEYVVSIKGPLTTPVGGGIRSLNVSLRQLLDLYVCLRPIRYFDGVPSPVKRPQDVDMVIFRENSEDIYCGVEFEGDSKEAKKLVKTLKNDFEVSKIRFEENVGIGVKPISQAGTTRLVKKAIDYAIANNRTSVTLVHKGNIMKFTEGAFRDWGYEVAKNDYGGVEIDEGPWQEITNPKNGKKIIIKDVICDAFLQQILLRPTEYDVIATMNLNGDYISDALAAMVGGGEIFIKGDKGKGEVVKTENWGLINLSYLIKKNKKGSYIHFKIKGKGIVIDELEKNEAIDKKLLRYLTVRVKKFDLETNYFGKKEDNEKKESVKN